VLHLGVGGHRADPPAAVGALDPVQPRNLAQVDQQRRRGQPQLHQRQQRMPAGEQLGILADLIERLNRLVKAVRRDVVELGGNHAAAPPLASWIASHTRIGVSGMLM
jgi:hypothetical protein